MIYVTRDLLFTHVTEIKYTYLLTAHQNLATSPFQPSQISGAPAIVFSHMCVLRLPSNDSA